MNTKMAQIVTNIFVGIGLLIVAANSNAVIITGYDVLNADPSGTGGWNHTYTGTITTGSLSGVFDYTGGTGSMADGSLPSFVTGNQLFLSQNSTNNVEITLYFDQIYSFSEILLLGTSGDVNNNIPGNISGFDVLIDGVTASVSTTGFGPVTTNETPSQNVHERADLIGTLVDGLFADSLTLSNFTVQDSVNQFRFSIGEIEVNGSSANVPEPAPLALMGLGLTAIVFTRKRKAK